MTWFPFSNPSKSIHNVIPAVAKRGAGISFRPRLGGRSRTSPLTRLCGMTGGTELRAASILPSRVAYRRSICTPQAQRSARPAALADRMRRREAAVDHDRLAVDVGAVVGREEQRRRGDLFGLAAALQRVELADA